MAFFDVFNRLRGRPAPQSIADPLERAAAHLQCRQPRETLAVLAEVKALRKPRCGVDLLRAKAFNQLGNRYDAAESLREELRWFPDNTEARSLLTQWAPPLPPLPDEIDPNLRQVLQGIGPNTMLSWQRLGNLWELARRVTQENIPGLIVDCGVAGGGSTTVLGASLAQHGGKDREIYGFDSFEGMPAPGEADRYENVTAQEAGWGAGTCAAPMTAVRDLYQRLDIQTPLHLVPGYFQDTLPVWRAERNPQIALLHADGDWYDSTRTIFEQLYDCVTPGGFVQIDDYGHWEGCRRAVDEFAASKGETLALHTIDYTGRWFEKGKGGNAHA